MARVLAIETTNSKEEPTEDGGLDITIPIRFRRTNGRKEIILPSGCGAETDGRRPERESIVSAVLRAHYWTELIESGRYRSVSELADACRLDRSYICKIIHLVNLAPDITEALLDGNEPPGLTLKRLREVVPALWAEQRELFGFPPAN